MPSRQTARPSIWERTQTTWTNDQRGELFLRDTGDGPDMGAFEFQGEGLRISGAEVDEGDSGTTEITFTIQLQGDSDPFTVDYATANGSTATTADNDYEAVSGTLSFDGNDGETKIVVVNVLGDERIEFTQGFWMVLSNITPDTTTINVDRALGLIRNDDSLSRVSFEDRQIVVSGVAPTMSSPLTRVKSISRLRSMDKPDWSNESCTTALRHPDQKETTSLTPLAFPPRCFSREGDGNDTLTGGSGNDSLKDNFGTDVLRGKQGDDTLDGGRHDDLLLAGPGHDVILGGDDDDTIQAGSGKDTVDGGNGKDSIEGSKGNDSINGGDGNDTVRASNGADFVDGGNGKNVLLGARGRDTLIGGEGRDTINGGSGNDSLEGGLGLISYEAAMTKTPSMAKTDVIH